MRVVFTPNLSRHAASAPVEVQAASVREALERAFAERPGLRDYVLDEQGELRRHMVVFVDGQQVRDRATLDADLHSDSEVYVMQALSGG